MTKNISDHIAGSLIGASSVIDMTTDRTLSDLDGRVVIQTSHSTKGRPRREYKLAFSTLGVFDKMFLPYTDNSADAAVVDVDSQQVDGVDYGPGYKLLWDEYWSELVRVLRPGGRVVLIITDFLLTEYSYIAHNGREYTQTKHPVTDFHLKALSDLGMLVYPTTKYADGRTQVIRAIKPTEELLDFGNVNWNLALGRESKTYFSSSTPRHSRSQAYMPGIPTNKASFG